MERGEIARVVLWLSVMALFLLLICSVYIWKRKRGGMEGGCLEEGRMEFKGRDDTGKEELICFLGGEDLTVYDILDAPGEVIGKSSYGTLYKAFVERGRSLRVLRFLRPVSGRHTKEVVSVVQTLGLVRHHNLVPLQAFYSGPKGEKLLVYPFYRHGNLSDFIRGGGNSSNWDVICDIAMGIARGLDHLHTGLHKPITHGNLKSKNILLDRHLHPFVSDYGLHLVLNPTASQEMLDTSAAEGYKAPELVKMKDNGPEADIHSFGVILLELITGKEAITENKSPVPDLPLPNTMRNAILNVPISHLLRPDISSGSSSKVKEEQMIDFFRLSLDCCSPSPLLRPSIKQVLKRLVEVAA